LDTYDGFKVQQWQDFVEFVLEQTKLRRDWLSDGKNASAIVAHQSRLRNRAAKKFSDSERWIWTAKLLEQSSDEKVAKMMASAFPKSVPVVDFCCGAGADTIALARRGFVTAVDRCEVACALTRANLFMHAASNQTEVVCSSAEVHDIGSVAWVHIDPDRRPDSFRTTQVDYFQPSLEFITKLIRQSSGGSIKLAPATKLDTFSSSLDDENRPALAVNPLPIGRQFVSWGGSVRQQRWWWNVAAYPAGTTTVSMMLRSSDWYHWTVTDSESAQCDQWSRVINGQQSIGGYIGDADGCVRAAGLQGVLANMLDASLIGNQWGYLLAEKLPTSSTPLTDWFQIEASMSFDRKRLRSYLREKNVGVLEIKVRNVEISPEVIRREMKLHGTESATVLITKCGPKTIAIVGKRVDATLEEVDTSERSLPF